MINYKVSVIIPTYGRAKLLTEAINSVINQTYNNIEIIVVDDNGLHSDNQIATSNQINAFNYPSLKYIPLEHNSGGAYARNIGAKAATGDFLCFLDDDDRFLPEKISQQLEALYNNTKAVGCYCGHIRNDTIHKTRVEYIPCERGDCRMSVLTFSVDFCSGSTLMVRKNAFQKVGGFDSKLKRFQDYQFLAQLSGIGEIECVSRPLVIINTHSGSYSLKSFCQIKECRIAYLKSIEGVIKTLKEEERDRIYEVNRMYLFKEALKFKEVKEALGFLKQSSNSFRMLYRTSIDIIRYFIKTKL